MAKITKMLVLRSFLTLLVALSAPVAFAEAVVPSPPDVKSNHPMASIEETAKKETCARRIDLVVIGSSSAFAKKAHFPSLGDLPSCFRIVGNWTRRSFCTTQGVGVDEDEGKKCLTNDRRYDKAAAPVQSADSHASSQHERTDVAPAVENIEQEDELDWTNHFARNSTRRSDETAGNEKMALWSAETGVHTTADVEDSE
ncbi:unnamed protein product, partial [Amoebophrya sp. A25]|eukprot:GSA25T00015821001.1